jgi:RHS repeat-associated protein
MGGMRFGRIRLVVRAQGPDCITVKKLGRGVGLLTVLLVGVLALAPAGASAEPLCTDTWIGPSEGSWASAEDWSSGVPTSSSVVCIGAGKTVTIKGEGTFYAGVIEDSGGLSIEFASLDITDALERSSVSVLTSENSNLIGPASLSVTTSLSWKDHSALRGGGSLIIQSGASMTATNSSTISEAAKLINEGTITLASGSQGSFNVTEGAEIKNIGTFNADSDIAGFVIEGSGSGSRFVNSGTFQTHLSGSESAKLGVVFINEGTVNAKNGILVFFKTAENSGANQWKSEAGHILFTEGSYSLTGGEWSGNILIEDGSVAAEGVTGTAAKVTVAFGSLSVRGGLMTVENLSVGADNSTLSGPGSLAVTKTLSWESEATMSGSGSLILRPGASGISSGTVISGHDLINEGTLTFTSGYIGMSEDAKIVNIGTFNANSENLGLYGPSGEGEFVNAGIFQKTVGSGTTAIDLRFINSGSVITQTGHFHFYEPVSVESSTQYGGPENPSTPGQPHPTCGDPVSCATGNLSETQTDFAIGGRGVGLHLTRTYNSQAAAAGAKGALGYGWTSSFSDHLVVNKTSKVATLYQANGSTVLFTEEGGGSFKAPVWTQDILSGTEGTAYTLTLANQIKYKFAGSSGRLESVTDRDGNATTLTYNGGGQLTTITDPVSRTIKLIYNGEGLVESAEDPMKHVVKYTYEAGNLKSVTQPAEVGLRWQFKYDGSHRMAEMVDGRGGKTVNEYNGSNQVTKQEDPAGHKLKFEYETFQTKITNENAGSVTDEFFTSNGEPSSITRGYGTASAATESLTYNEGGYVTGVTDGNGHTTTYGYSGASDRTSMVDPNKNETKWTYDATHDVETMTTPKGEVTTIKREAHGNPESISRPAPGSTTQTTKYKYAAHGELESVEDPLKRVWKYEYDAAGDRTSEADPLSDKRTWGYNEDSQETSTVSPRGNVAGGEPAKFTTKIERDAQGRALTVTDPLAHTTKYAYDGDGNVETLTDGNGHITKYTYNADNRPTKVEAPNKAITETGYDGAGQVTSQIDGSKHETKYVRNVLEQVTEVVDPLGHKTKKEYDLAGNLKILTDPAKRTTTYTYDPGNRLKEVVYSSGKPATVKYEYDKDGDRTVITDGTGTSKYTYDQLDRLTEAETGHKEKSKYEYDLANEQTKITYPNTKSVTRTYDKAGRLEKVTDWLEGASKFSYDADSDLTTTTFPTSTGDVDKYEHNQADQMSSQTMVKGTETLASLAYAHDNDGQVKSGTVKGLPGEEKPSYEYDTNNRLTKGVGVAYEYDAANNATKIGTGAYKYNAGSELETGPRLAYTYDELGERTKTKPTTGPATTYGYDQAGELTSVERPKEGETAEIKDSYAYDGNGLRASQTIAGTTTYMVWDLTEGLPLLLSDTTNSYIYGPGGLPVEQISSGGTVTYLHHDQQGSTRLLTGSAGTVTGSTTFDAYGNKTGSTGTGTTPLGYDGQYTSSDTGLVYLRARTYDPATAQFLSVDPLVENTETPYGYAAESPLTFSDPTGFFSLPLLGSISEDADAACGVTFEVPGLDAVTCGAAAAVTAYLGARALSETVRLAAENASSTSLEVAEGAPEGEQDVPCTIPRSLPYRGEPNSTEALDRGNGSGQIRDYGPDGLPERDFDFGHNHGFGDPHAHDWLDGERGLGRPIGPNE